MELNGAEFGAEFEAEFRRQRRQSLSPKTLPPSMALDDTGRAGVAAS